MKLILGMITLLVLNMSVFAEEGHELTNMTGPNIELKAYDHGFAGSIKDFIAFGYLNEDTGISELTIRKDAQTFLTQFKRVDGKVGGTIRHTVEDREIVTKMEFVQILPGNIIVFKINGVETQVKMTSTDFSDGHFINPTYTMNYNGEELKFTLENGEACYGLSIHYAMMIFGAYIH